MVSERSTMERAQRLIRAATGEECGDGYTVMDMCVGYAEPGYGSGDVVIVFGNWNDKKWENPTLAERMPSRLGDALKRVGCEIEWYDEWTTCSNCYRAIRTQGDSYSWKLYGAVVDCEYVCADCLHEDIPGYVEEYVNNPDRAITWANGADLESVGFTRWAPNDPQSYENGWHPGQTDEPRVILSAILDVHEDAEVVFVLDEASQFYIVFSAYVRGIDA